MPQADEFIDTYSDDVLYIIDARKTLLTHPFRAEIKALCDASFCRLLIVFMIGSIEAMIEHWKTLSNNPVLDTYLAENASNAERVESLRKAFENAEIEVDSEVFDDYLAIKYLRNTIVHSRWKAREMEWVEERHFPIDTRNLTEQHWNRILDVNQNMMMYIALTGIPELVRGLPHDKIVRLKPKQEEEIEPFIITRKNLPFVIFRNLEHIAEKIHDSIWRVGTSEKYSWTRPRAEVPNISDDETEIMRYIAVQEASVEGVEEIARHRELVDDAFYFWQLYMNLTFQSAGIGLAELDDSLEVIMQLHEKQRYLPSLPVPWSADLPHMVKRELVKPITVDLQSGVTEDQIVKAFDVGELAYGFMRNITPVSLFGVYFPIVNAKGTKLKPEEIGFILAAWRLREAWYSYIEYHKRPDSSKSDFYEKLSARLQIGL
jgi:hypothetical protein